ncbi:hypothetical protein F3087_19160 [Nocardia colli]|uniref:Uncharacterized protein n=1 Tax=Nocardia colli TaxID=2545717 RepID=A0A5N0EE03_9NOCA|nr:hypothetical protein [Nocardia colli]KAA8887040.1 hypothetical protein F3087_19160 [Nocardia colli]
MTQSPTTPDAFAHSHPVPPPSGGTAVTAGVLACLGGAHRLLSILALVVGIAMLSELDVDSETYFPRMLFAISIPIFLVDGALLLAGGIQMFRKRASARRLIIIGCAVDLAYLVIEAVVVLAVAGPSDDYGVLFSPLFAVVVAAFPIATIILTSRTSTTRWLDYRA